MRILQLIDTLNIGGAERMAVNISNVLQEGGHQVILCASWETGSLEKFVDEEVKVVSLKKKNALDIFAFIRFLKIIISQRIELIHAHSSSIFWAVAAKIVNPDLQIIWHDHFGLGDRLKGSDRIAWQFISPMIDAIIAVNETLMNWSRRNMKVKNDNIVFINNFPLLPELQRQSATEITTIICLANLRAQKDHLTLIKAIDLLQKSNPNPKLKVIFAGIILHDEYLNNITQLITELGLNDTIQLAGPVEDTASLLAGADIGVLSSVSEGLPVSLLEYGLAGLPVVVTNVGQCSDVVGNGKYGKVVPASRPSMFANELSWLIENPQLAKDMGNAFKNQVEQNYGANRFLREYEELLKKISYHA